MRPIDLLAIVTICAGCARHTPPAPAPAPPPTPIQPRAVETAPTVIRPFPVCVVADGGLREVLVDYVPATGDSLYQGRRFREVFPVNAQYAANAQWYMDNSAVSFDGRWFSKYGQPRPLAIHELTRIGEYRGVGVYSERAQIEAPAVIYLPLRPGCEFQPYQTAIK
jgi:hypothetical protein